MSIATMNQQLGLLALLVLALTTAGCGNRSMTVINQSDSPLQLEVAIGYEPYRLFTSNQNYRFRLAQGETWHSRDAHRDHRVQWPAAGGVHTGILIRSREMPLDEYEVYSVSDFNGRHTTVVIAGNWPHYEIIAFGDREQSIELTPAWRKGMKQK